MNPGEKKRDAYTSPIDQAKIITARIELGAYLREKRNLAGLSTRALGEELNVSSNYISEIERGIKPPSDHLLREYANILKLDENELFKMLDKVPLKATETLEKHEQLQNLLSEMNDSDLADDEIDQLFDIMTTTFNKYMNNKKEGKQQNFNGKFYPRIK
jgi:transcriptional regulator with XRE-family HTH domain